MHVLISLGSWLVAMLLLRLGGVRIIAVSPTSIFFLFTLVYTGVAQLTVGAWIDGLLPGVPLEAILWSEQYASEIILYLCSFLVAYAMGVFLARVINILYAAPTTRIGYRHSGEHVILDQSLYIPALVGFLSLAAVAALLFFSRFGIPVAQADPDAARYSALEQGGYALLLPAYFYLNPLVAAVSLGVALRRDQAALVRILCVALLAASIGLQLTSALAGFRAFLITYVVVLVSIYCLARRVSTSSMIVTALLCAAGVVAVTWLKYAGSDETGLVIAAKILNRVVLDSYFTLRIIFSIFDEVDPLLGASYVWDLYSKMPGEQLSFQGFLTSKWINESEFNIALAPTLAGEMYANFLWLGVGAAFSFGLILRLLEMWFLIRRDNGVPASAPVVGAYCTLTIVAERSVTVGLGGVFFLAIVVSILIATMWCSAAALGALNAAARH